VQHKLFMFYAKVSYFILIFTKSYKLKSNLYFFQIVENFKYLHYLALIKLGLQYVQIFLNADIMSNKK
jgi:hypothetical protein